MKTALKLLLAGLAFLAAPVKDCWLQAQTLPNLRVSSNNRYLVKEDGSPFFFLGDTGWQLFHNLNRTDALTYLQNRADKKYTVIQAVLIAEFGGLDNNAQGDKPLANNNPSTPLTTPGNNPANATEYDYWDHVDFIVNEAAARGLYVGMLPTWGKWVNDAGAIFNTTNAQAYGQFLGARYGNRVIWILGGDRNAGGKEAIWRAMAKGIALGATGSEDYSRLLMTYHPAIHNSSSNWFQSDTWLDFNMIESGHCCVGDAYTYDGISSDYTKTPAKPTMDSEGGYEDHPINWNTANGYFRDWESRKRAYWSVFAGGHGFTYGHHSIWQFYPGTGGGVASPDRSWRDALNRPGAYQMTYLRNLMESRPLLLRIPDQSILSSSSGSGNSRAQATRASDGSYLFVYLTSGNAVSINMNKITGSSVRGWWFNPRTGAATDQGTFSNAGTRQFNPPSSGNDNDWVLVLDDASKNYPAPGTVVTGQPTVSITSPLNGSTFVPGTALTIQATATDADGSVTKVEFFAGATKLGEDLTSPYSYTWNSVPAGEHTLMAKATDNAGKTASSSVTITPVDLTEGGSITVSSTNSPSGEGPEKAFDNTTSSKWLVFASSGWISYDFAGEQAYAVNQYTVASANDSPGRDPKNWSLKGSNDGTSWVTVDTRTNELFASRFQTKTYSITNTTAYKQYRLEVTANNGGAELQLSEIQLFGPAGSTPAAGTVAAKQVTSSLTVDGNLNETAWSITNTASKTTIGSPNNTVEYGVLWNSTYLYVGVRVSDGNLYNDSPNDWEDDAVEIYIDADNNGATSYDSKDRQFVKGYNSTTLSGSGSTTGVLHATTAIAGGYSVELAIPWSNLGITPTANLTLGFDIGNNDDDNGGTRDHQVVWWGNINNYSNTAAFGDLLLSATTAARTSHEVATASKEPSLQLSLYPNPVTTNKVEIIHYASQDGTVAVRVLDELSRVATKQMFQVKKGKNQLSVDLAAVKNGMHLLELKEGHKRIVKKLLIAR